MRLPSLQQCPDRQPLPCSEQMALDEVLFRYTQKTGIACIRFYQWEQPAATFGYSEAYPTVIGPGAIRRFTGGGLVEHGEDETFLLTLPADSKLAAAKATERYRWIHVAIARSLQAAGLNLKIETKKNSTAIGPCFTHPVPYDLVRSKDGKKIVGGAQRRSRGSVIHQGSLQLPKKLRENPESWRQAFLAEISEEFISLSETTSAALFSDGKQLSQERYETDAWNHRR